MSNVNSTFQFVHLDELEKQCRFVRNASRSLDKAIHDLNKGAEKFFQGVIEGLPEDHHASTALRSYFHEEVFRHIHSILTHAANVSKILWPDNTEDTPRDSSTETARKAARKSRGEKLRRVLGVLGDDHVLKSKAVRNRLEHFDEDLDDWMRNGSGVTVLDNIGPTPDFKACGIKEANVMRWFDPGTGDFISRGQKSNLWEVISAADRLLAQVADARKRA